MARTMKPHMISMASIFIIISMSRIHVSEAAGFSVDLIHRDSLKSPSLYSSSQQVRAALQRSFNHLNYLAKDYSQSQPSSEIVPDRGEYLMKFSLGTPPVEMLAIADTGSDLIWVQCKPCIKCFNQNAPLFQSNTSSTYKPVSCSSSTCTALRSTSCNGEINKCRYAMSYGDRSSTQGDLATETITLGTTFSIPNVTMGCGHYNQGTFGEGASGIVGLGGGKVSLIKQMGNSIQGKFSYCLVPYLGESTKSSKMSFGDEAVVSGAHVVSTPIVAKTPDTFYFLTLEGMTVGNERLDLVSSSDDDDEFIQSESGNIIIDSGTTLTFLPSQLYHQVTKALRSQVKLTEVNDPTGMLSLCYDPTSGNVSELPEITVHFRGGDVKLKPVNTFLKTSPSSLCLAFATSNSLAIFGNVAQYNFLVGYDLEKKTVSFKPTDCSKA